jgi:hypothetical protein
VLLQVVADAGSDPARMREDVFIRPRVPKTAMSPVELPAAATTAADVMDAARCAGATAA